MIGNSASQRTTLEADQVLVSVLDPRTCGGYDFKMRASDASAFATLAAQRRLTVSLSGPEERLPAGFAVVGGYPTGGPLAVGRRAWRSWTNTPPAEERPRQ